ncbi:MAG: helix-turn-helix transcriptional regulator [Eubacteriales bacterium]|nr:helix-turn-helix transcriptional regulator [Eubacteriales bacterium]
MNQEYARVIVNRIVQLCEQRGISVNHLADMSGVAQSTLDNLINGRTFNPQIKTLHKVALAFSMTLAEFLDYKELNEFNFEE